MLGTSVYLRLYAYFLQFRVYACDYPVDELYALVGSRRHLVRDILVIFGVEIFQGKVFKLPLYARNTQTGGDGRVYIQRFLGNTLPGGGVFERKRAHIVQPVRKFDDYHAYVVGHGKEHTAVIFRLRFFLRLEVEHTQLGNAVHERSHRAAEFFLYFAFLGARILHHVVQKRGYDAVLVHAEIH